MDTEGHSNIANLPPWPLSCSKGNFHISSHHKFELSCSKCSIFLFRALWEQRFPSDCISVPTFPENCQSCSKSPSILNGQIKLCLSRAVIYLPRGLRTRFQKIRFGEIMWFNHILNMTHLLRLYYLNPGALQLISLSLVPMFCLESIQKQTQLPYFHFGFEDVIYDHMSSRGQRQDHVSQMAKKKMLRI